MDTRSRPGRLLTSWVFVMAVLVALPIMAGVSAFAWDIAHRLTVARTERAGLDRISELNRFITDLLRYRERRLCAGCVQGSDRAARAAVDTDIARITGLQQRNPFAVDDWNAVSAAWKRYRAQPRIDPVANDQIFAALMKAYVHTSDESNLTYDPDTAGIDIADALTYRLPPAIDFSQRAGLVARGSGSQNALDRRLFVVNYRAQAHVLLVDMFADLQEATALRPRQAASIAPALRTASSALFVSDRMFSTFVRQPVTAWSRADEKTSDSTLRALLTLDASAMPAIGKIIQQRVTGYHRTLWLLLVPGLSGLCAALLIVIFAALALRHRANLQAAERLAAVDALTNVMSRRHFEATLEEQRRNCERTHAPLSLVIIDVDHFKSFNDAYGHVAGDMCLQRVAQAAATCMRTAQDMLARYGGEEFVAILPATELMDAVLVAERIRAAIYDLAVPHQGTTLRRISVSVGVASAVPDAGTTNQSLVDHADYWLYRAKENGRNRVCAQGYISRTPAANQRPASA